MTGKKVVMPPRPSKQTPTADEYVVHGIAGTEVDGLKGGEGGGEARSVKAEPIKMKRLTIDIEESLHRKIKADCATRGSKIVDEVRDLLKQKYRNTET